MSLSVYHQLLKLKNNDFLHQELVQLHTGHPASFQTFKLYNNFKYKIIKGFQLIVFLSMHLFKSVLNKSAKYFWCGPGLENLFCTFFYKFVELTIFGPFRQRWSSGQRVYLILPRSENYSFFSWKMLLEMNENEQKEAGPYLKEMTHKG